MHQPRSNNPKPATKFLFKSDKKLCFIPYIGGKFNLLNKLISLIPEHETYVEVFGGVGSLLLNKPPSKVEVFNDIDGDLINLFLVVRDTSCKLRHVLSPLLLVLYFL
jgi:DNA adenine methylase